VFFNQTGEQARGFFLKSNLPTNVLGQIWNLADLNKDGRLDNKEFSIACFIIKKVLTHPQGASIVPAVIPSSLLIDPQSTTSTPVTSPTSPTQIVPLTKTSTTAASPPIVGSNVSSVPLFQANFPPMTSTTQPLLGSAPNATSTSLPGAVRLPGLATSSSITNLATASTANPSLFPSLLPSAPLASSAFPIGTTAPPTLPPATFNANFAVLNSNTTPNL
jgi:epidermal growth factor receptor substrate 15